MDDFTNTCPQTPGGKEEQDNATLVRSRIRTRIAATSVSSKHTHKINRWIYICSCCSRYSSTLGFRSSEGLLIRRHVPRFARIWYSPTAGQRRGTGAARHRVGSGLNAPVPVGRVTQPKQRCLSSPRCPGGRAPVRHEL